MKNLFNCPRLAQCDVIHVNFAFQVGMDLRLHRVHFPSGFHLLLAHDRGSGLSPDKLGLIFAVVTRDPREQELLRCFKKSEFCT